MAGALALLRRFKPAWRLDSGSNQCEEWPSSFVEVAKRIEHIKTTAMRGTTKNGEEMICTVETP
jgi:hypothetical protein